MSLRLKLMVSLIVLAVVATLAIGVASYTTTRQELERTVDRSLDDAARRLGGRQLNGVPLPGRPTRPGAFEQILVQRIASDGTVIEAPDSGAFAVTDADLQVASSIDPDAQQRHDVEIDGEQFRVLTVNTGQGTGQVGGALMLARSLREVDQSLETILRGTLWAVVLVAIASALVGWLIARQVTRRLTRLTIAAGAVTSSGRLDVDVPVDGADETGRLGRAFAGMLQSLQRSKREQHQLVQDASHELRTPLTSLRTNVAVLRRGLDQLQPEAREQLLADLDSESRELSDLVNELVELATEARDDEPSQPMRLVDVADRAAERARRRFNRDVSVHADASLVNGRPAALERAVQNLIDNACKFAPAGAIEVTVSDATVTVRDHGPGLIDADLPHLFDRFYRSVQMRGMPGSGLGLAIVKSVAEAHGGSVFARNAEGGGAELGFRLATINAVSATPLA
ncbi:MAG: HAMP domain-containing histidine kinase [Actinobacteria bacterium]|nr:HAMP domain-containing histidine kinase [Actinomycetota bacterium]